MSESKCYCVTITGADDEVNPALLKTISDEYPFVEWGFLFSPKHEGDARYPSRAWVERALRWNLPRVAAHLCGQYTRSVMLGECVHWPVGSSFFQRVQLNGFDFGIGTAAMNVIAATPQQEFILQVRDAAWATTEQVDFMASQKGNVSALYDLSGGRGIEPASWPAPSKHCRWGYAGGINPDNVERVLEACAAHGRPFWIDMESGVRTDNHFDIEKVLAVVGSVSKWQLSER